MNLQARLYRRKAAIDLNAVSRPNEGREELARSALKPAGGLRYAADNS
jgi:hypothetical protein